MTRYFMTIPEAVQLVLQAAVLAGLGGEVFVLDMGQPIRIADLARDLVELSGFQVGRDIDIVYTGLRPGEKLTEELFFQQERHDRTVHEKIFLSRNGCWHAPAASPAEGAGPTGAALSGVASDPSPAAASPVAAPADSSVDAVSARLHIEVSHLIDLAQSADADAIRRQLFSLVSQFEPQADPSTILW